MECLSGGHEEPGSSASSCDVLNNSMSEGATHTGSSSPVGSGDSSRCTPHFFCPPQLMLRHAQPSLTGLCTQAVLALWADVTLSEPCVCAAGIGI